MTHWFWSSLKRELRASWLKLSLATVSLLIATCALTSILLTDARLAQATLKQAEHVLGGDAEIHDVRLLPTSLVESLESSGKIARGTRISTFVTIIAPGVKHRARLVETLAIDEAWPLLSSVQILPAAKHDQLKAGGVLIEKSFAQTYGLEVYEEEFNTPLRDRTLQKIWQSQKAIKIGKEIFPVIGIVENDQSRNFASFATGARIYIARSVALKQQFISPQSRLRDKFLLQFAPDISQVEGQKWLKEQVMASQSSSVRVTTKDDALGSAFKPARSLFLFYDAIGFSLLILLGLGTAQAIHSYLIRKHSDAKILTMIGAPHTQTALIYLGNVFLLLILAIGGGVWTGYELFSQYIFPRLAMLTPGLSLNTDAQLQSGLTLRFTMSVFILTVALLLPGALLYFKGAPRSVVQPFKKNTHMQKFKELTHLTLSNLRNFPDLIWLIAAFFLSFLVSKESVFNLVLVAVITVVYGCVRIAVGVIGKFGITSRFRLPLFLRIAASELSSRPTQSSLSLMLFCLSVCLVVFLLDLRGNIVNQLTAGFSSGARPNIFVLDSPQDDIGSVEKIMNSADAKEVITTRMTRARILSINDMVADDWLVQMKKQTEVSQRAQHMLNREQNLTTRAELTPEEEVVAGKFWDKSSDNSAKNEVSVELGLAKTLNLKLNDKIVFNVQGVPVSAQITSLRRVQWQSFKPNFFFVLHPSLLNEAPFSGLITAAIADPDKRREALNQLYKAHPGLTSIDADEFSKIAEKLITSAIEIVRYLSAMLFAGAFLNIILSAWNSFTLRARNFSLYRCIGANNRLVVSSCLTEYLLIALGGGLIGLVSSWGLSASIEKIILTSNDQLNTSVLPSLIVLGSVLLIAVVVGVASATLILREAPLKNLKRPI